MKIIYREKKKTKNGMTKEIYSVNANYYKKNEIVKFEDKIKNKIFYLKAKEETEWETCDKCFFCKYRMKENTFCNISCYKLKDSSYFLNFEEIPMFKILFGKEFKNNENGGNKKINNQFVIDETNIKENTTFKYGNEYYIPKKN